MGDGDVLALTIEQGSEGGTERPFVLFSAEPTSLFRGACVAAGAPLGFCGRRRGGESY